MRKEAGGEDMAAVTLLIVDDEPDICQGLKSVLPWELLGIALLDAVTSAKRALDDIARLSPDIVIADIHMPEMDGLVMIRRALSAGSEARFVLLTGYDEFSYAREAIACGVKRYLLKPVSVDEMRETMEALVREIGEARKIQSRRESESEELKSISEELRRARMIADLLKGGFTDAELRSRLEECPLSLADAPVNVALIDIASSMPESAGRDDRLRDCLARAFRGHGAECAHLRPDRAALVYNADLFPDAEACVVRALSEAERAFGLRAVAAMGEPAARLAELPSCMLSATRVMAYRIYPALLPVLTPRLLALPAPPAFDYPVLHEPVLDAILAGDEARVASAMREYFQKILYIQTPPPAALFGLCNYLALDIRRALSEVCGESPRSMLADAYMLLQGLDTLSQVMEWMTGTMVDLARETRITSLSRTDAVMQKALAYIDSHILDNPPLSDVCRYACMSQSSFARY